MKEAIIGLREHSEHFLHGLGHGIGLDIHELPNLTPASIEKYQNNMTFTVEPNLLAWKIWNKD
jgi:Xaa-Pro aminopeptidase